MTSKEDIISFLLSAVRVVLVSIALTVMLYFSSRSVMVSLPLAGVLRV